MCTVSMIYDYARERIPMQTWTTPIWSEFQDVIRRLESLDRKLDQPDCHDPQKAEWMKAVEERLRALESGERP